METIELGNKVKCKITGFTGIAICKHIYLNGCVQYGVQGKINKDGFIIDPEEIDEEDLIVMKTGGVKNPIVKQGGPRNRRR